MGVSGVWASDAEGGDPASEVLLYYRYARLSAEDVAAAVEEQHRLGAELCLRGRVLVAREGINGTVQADCAAGAVYRLAVEARFGAVDWKRSAGQGQELFPDFAVKEVAEIVGFGFQEAVPLDVEREGGTHLAPGDFHRVLTETPPESLRVIDVRNTFEYEIGHFDGAQDTGMTHTAQWPRFVKKNLEDLRGKTVMLYCTGGVRCEKASAYLNRCLSGGSCDKAGGEINESGGVYQLEGGIHRYLEHFPDGGRFKGANFVFDKRAQMLPESASGGKAVGRCSECSESWGRHHGGRVCCVCRALVLVCDNCDAASSHGEYYCAQHSELRGFYFHFVDRFGPEELARQSEQLRARLAEELGTKRKNRRATLRKKAEQVEERLAVVRRAALVGEPDVPFPPRRCRACERPYAGCSGACWGFWKGPNMAEAPDATTL